MITLGIDLSSQPTNTAVCRIKWTDDGTAIASKPEGRCDDLTLDKHISEADVVGIDAPFGWPMAFAASVGSWTAQIWTVDLRDRMRFRTTDIATHQRTSLWPLSVSSDRIALPAMRAMALLERHGVTDKSGDGRFYEVYPAGSLACWNLPRRGYKRGPEALGKRKQILEGIRRRFPEMTIPSNYCDNDHALDSLLAAITARMAKLGSTIVPDAPQLVAARVEGWIHLPRKIQ